MSLRYQWYITQSEGLRQRLAHAATKAGVKVQADWWVATHIERLAALDGWVALWQQAWEQGKDSREDYDPGWDEARITDQAIADAVTTLIAEDDADAEVERQAKEAEEAQRKAEQQAADEAMTLRQRADEEWRMQLHAERAAATSTVPQDDPATARLANRIEQLETLITRDELGRPEAVNYDRIAANIDSEPAERKATK